MTYADEIDVLIATKGKGFTCSQCNHVTPLLDGTIEMLFYEDVGLDVRAFNALRNGGIKTVRDLINCSEGELLTLKNLGLKTLPVIKSALAAIGLRLKPADYVIVVNKEESYY